MASVLVAVEMFGEGSVVEVRSERQGVVRFGGSRITNQHAEDRLQVRIGSRRNGRSGWITTETLDPDRLWRLRDRLRRNLAAGPAGEPVVLSSCGAEPGSRATCAIETRTDDIKRRLGWFHTALATAGSGTLVGGSAATTRTDHIVADHNGLWRAETRTRAALTVIAERNGRSSFGRELHRDAEKIDPARVARSASEALDVPEAGDPTPPGSRVLLSPHAVATLVATFGLVSFGATEFRTGVSPLHSYLGSRTFSERITIDDDGSDPAGLPTGFDGEGGTKRPVRLVRAGTPVGMVHDRMSAARYGVVTTGHAVPPGWRFGEGPAPSHLVVGAGPASQDDLLAELGDGLMIQRLDYVRVLQPRQSLVTGTTRDATLIVRSGRIVGAGPQLRFTARLDQILDSVCAVGRVRERSETVFMESVVAPAMVVGGLGDVEPTGR